MVNLCEFFSERSVCFFEVKSANAARIPVLFQSFLFQPGISFIFVGED